MLTQTRLAISIEGRSIRLLLCRGRSVRWWAEVGLQPRILRNGFLADARGFSEALRASVQSAKMPKGKVMAAMAGFQSFFRIIRVPSGVGGKLGSVVASEARRAIPDIERNMFLYWQPFGQKDRLQRSVFMLAVPRQSLITYMEALGNAGLRPASIDLRPLSLARAVNQEDAIIGNSESMSLDVIIVRNDVPMAIRSLYLGEEFESVEYVNTRLADELSRTLRHFDITSQDGPLPQSTPIFLTGAGATDPNLIGMVQEMTQHPVARLQTPFSTPKDFPLDKFMVHLGLMLK